MKALAMVETFPRCSHTAHKPSAEIHHHAKIKQFYKAFNKPRAYMLIQMLTGRKTAATYNVTKKKLYFKVAL